MKRFFVCLMSLALVCALLLCVVGCTRGIDKDDAKAEMKAFLEAVAAEDYETAASYLHPDRPIDLKAYFASVEAEEGLDFSAGVEIQRNTGFSSAWYDSEVDGSYYALEMAVKVGGVLVDIEIEIVNNDGGYGIYDVEIDN